MLYLTLNFPRESRFFLKFIQKDEDVNAIANVSDIIQDPDPLLSCSWWVFMYPFLFYPSKCTHAKWFLLLKNITTSPVPYSLGSLAHPFSSPPGHAFRECNLPLKNKTNGGKYPIGRPVQLKVLQTALWLLHVESVLQNGASRADLADLESFMELHKTVGKIV